MNNLRGLALIRRLNLEKMMIQSEIMLARLHLRNMPPFFYLTQILQISFTRHVTWSGEVIKQSRT